MYFPTTAIFTRSTGRRIFSVIAFQAERSGSWCPGEPLAHHPIESLLQETHRDLVDRLHIGTLDHAAEVDIAEEGDLALDVGGERVVAAADQHVRLDPDFHQLADRVLRGLGLELAGRRDERHQGQVHEERILAADFLAELPDGLEERQRLDVADRAADLDDHDVDVRAPRRMARLISSVMWGITCTVEPR